MVERDGNIGLLDIDFDFLASSNSNRAAATATNGKNVATVATVPVIEFAIGDDPGPLHRNG